MRSSLRSRLGIPRAFLHAIVQELAQDQKVSGSLSISFVGSAAMRTLNRGYRHKDKVTDILSFPAREGEAFIVGEDDDLGDIVLCYPRLVAQARCYQHSLKDEVRILVVHGVLHLLGYDHETDADFHTMKKIEERIIQKIT